MHRGGAMRDAAVADDVGGGGRGERGGHHHGDAASSAASEIAISDGDDGRLHALDRTRCGDKRDPEEEGSYGVGAVATGVGAGRERTHEGAWRRAGRAESPPNLERGAWKHALSVVPVLDLAIDLADGGGVWRRR